MQLLFDASGTILAAQLQITSVIYPWFCPVQVNNRQVARTLSRSSSTAKQERLSDVFSRDNSEDSRALADIGSSNSRVAFKN